jgi:hypothetical protein
VVAACINLNPAWLRAWSAASIFRLICQNSLILVTCKVINYVRGNWYSVTSTDLRKRALFPPLHEKQSTWAWSIERMHDKM